MIIIDHCIKYLIGEVEGKKIKVESLHPWRKDALHILQHSLRVKSYTELITESENIILDNIDKVALPVAAILHDIGNVQGKYEHAKKGVDMIQPFLETTFNDRDVIDRINELIMNHSNKKERSKDQVLNILVDADLLDEIGMQSVMMCSNWLDKDTAFFFQDFQNRIKEKELDFIEDTLSVTHFESSKKMLQEKTQFVKSIIVQLETENYGSLSRETYKRLTT